MTNVHKSYLVEVGDRCSSLLDESNADCKPVFTDYIMLSCNRCQSHREEVGWKVGVQITGLQRAKDLCGGLRNTVVLVKLR